MTKKGDQPGLEWRSCDFSPVSFFCSVSFLSEFLLWRVCMFVEGLDMARVQGKTVLQQASGS